MAKKLKTNGIARIDRALTLLTRRLCEANSAEIGRLKSPGELMRKKSAKKKTLSKTTAINPSADKRRGGSSSIGSSSRSSFVALRVERVGRSVKSLVKSCRGWKIVSFSKNLTESTATDAAHKVAMNAVPTIAVGRLEPDAARIAIAVVGISWTELVLMARNVHIALLAMPGVGLSVSKSRMARRPSGVAAFPKPSMLAAMFITIDPIAG